MKFFEAQKRAAFATQLLANAGLDLDALLTAGNADALKSQLAAPSALFSAAGLDLAAMLAAGPDALKAHLASLDNTKELAEALQEVERLSAEVETAAAAATQSAATLAAHAAVFSAVGFTPTAETKPEDIKGAFDAHVAKQTTLALAKTGHPPVAAVPVDDLTPKANDQVRADAALLAEYERLIAESNTDKASGAARADFYAKNHAAIQRAITARRRE